MESPGLCKEMEQLPTDLILEIFLRLPSKSVARFCTLSKHWASTLRSRNFAELFLARSSARPRLLFAVKKYEYNMWQFFSTPQPQNQNEKLSHVDFHSNVKGDVSQHICSYASGLLCFSEVICNPINGFYVRLPPLKMYRFYVTLPYLKIHGESRGFAVFDPIDKQFKVIKQNRYNDHCILTLGTGELSWRSNKTIKCDFLNEEICINGILYCLALEYDEGEGLSLVPVIVCFDVRSEEFSFIKVEWFGVQTYNQTVLRLVNYKGKLGGIDWKRVEGEGRSTVELCMWVLEDVENQEWVNYVYTLPENEVLSSCDFSIAGVTATGDIVLAMKYIRKPFYVFYFNPERNTLQSVEIQGFGADLETAKYHSQVQVFVDHIEDLSLNNVKELKSNISHIESNCACCKKKQRRRRKRR